MFTKGVPLYILFEYLQIASDWNIDLFIQDYETMKALANHKRSSEGLTKAVEK